MEELSYHVPYRYKTGTRLRVSGIVPEAHAWHMDWSPEATALVSKLVTVVAHGELAGYKCTAKGMPSAWLPSCALEPPYQQGENCVIEVPSI